MAKLTKSDSKKKQRHKPTEEDGDMPAGGFQPCVQLSADSDSDSEHIFLFSLACSVLIMALIRDPEDKMAKMWCAVCTNNFTQQTNALDVDKHM